MDLLEYQGKSLFRRHGIPVPAGSLWPDVPDWTGPLVVKAQVASGKRGKRGGIRFVNDASAARSAAEDLASASLGGEPVAGVYLEQRLEIGRETYLAIVLDRDRRCPVLLASPQGGIDVEDASAESLLRLPIDPLLGLQAFHVAAAVRRLDVGDEAADDLAAVVRALYALVSSEDATLAEINPLVLTGEGRVVAADAKVTLDDNAAFRRRSIESRHGTSTAQRSPLEAGVADAGAIGIEVDPDGDIVAVVSGAGLMMATLDILREANQRVRAVVDLGGSVLAGGEALGRIFQAVAEAAPRATFLNAYMHTAMCDELARMLTQAQRIAPLEGRVVARLKGRNGDVGRDLLSELGFEVFEDLPPAIQAIVGSKEVA